MKICQLLLSQGDGGLEKHVRELSEQLSSSGHKVAVIGGAPFLAGLSDGIERHPIPVGLGRLNPLLYFYVIRALRRFNADIIHAQANKAVFVLAALRNVVSARKIGTLHNIKKNTRIFKQLDHVITVSQQLASPFNSETTSVVYNGIQSKPFIRRDLYREFSLSEGAPILVAVGRLVHAKGFDMLLNAIDGLDVNLLLVGDGPLRSELETKAKKVTPSTQIRFLGQRQDVTDLMASADAVLISSRREGFSYVFSEAVLARRPVLSTDVPVANEVLPAELITPIDEPALFREKLQQLLAQPTQWVKLMQLPYQHAAQSMTLEAMANQTLATYQKLLHTPC